jgi:hypothetical protein
MGLRFREIRRLASFFSFDRSFQQDRHPQSILTTIAWDLAHWNSDFRKALEKVIRANEYLATTQSVTDQWKSLILDPAQHIKVSGPVLIVIDAFDESSHENSPSRRLLLNVLSKDAGGLPRNFRILITSRPERDVSLSLQPPSTHSIDSFNLSAVDSEHRRGIVSDIKTYVLHTLRVTDDPDDDPLTEEQLKSLAEKSEGNFQWAFTACNFILLRAGLPLQERVEKFLSTFLQGSSSLDYLYTEILERTFLSEDLDVLARFRSVMAQILSASLPLSVTALEDIRMCAAGSSKREISFIVRSIGALVSGTDNTSSPIRPLHTSFRDFLTSSSRSGKWCIDPQNGHDTMSLGCIRLLNRCLRFNICCLETSYRRNRDVPNLDSRVTQYTSEALRYAASFWKDHVREPDAQSIFYSEFCVALRECLAEKLLYWLELLSILGRVSQAAACLKVAAEFLKASISAAHSS